MFNWFGYLNCFNQYSTMVPRDYPCQEDGWQPLPTEGGGCSDISCASGVNYDVGDNVDVGANATGVDPATVNPDSSTTAPPSLRTSTNAKV